MRFAERVHPASDLRANLGDALNNIVVFVIDIVSVDTTTDVQIRRQKCNQRISVRADRIIAVQRIERAAPDVVAVAPPLGNDDLYIRILAAGSRNDPLEPVGEIACCEEL